MRSTFPRGLSRCCCLLGLAGMTALGLQAQTTVNLLNYTGYSGCPEYPLPAAHPSPNNNHDGCSPATAGGHRLCGEQRRGTVTIPGDLCSWYLSKPVFLDRDNVTIDGLLGAWPRSTAADGPYNGLPLAGTRHPAAGVRVGNHFQSSHRPVDDRHG